jgi:hypothetical protein
MPVYRTRSLIQRDAATMAAFGSLRGRLSSFGGAKESDERTRSISAEYAVARVFHSGAFETSTLDRWR